MAASAGAIPADEVVTTLWRGVNDLHAITEFKSRGGTELAFLSATSSRALAEERALFKLCDESEASGGGGGGKASRTVLGAAADLEPSGGAADADHHDEDHEEDGGRALGNEKTMPLLLKIRADVLNGTDLSFLSCFPRQAECVYPPATYLEARTSWDESCELPSGETMKFTVMECVPRLADGAV